jgi:hypothetical protein
MGADTVSAATGTGITIRDKLPLFPSVVPMMLALPAAIAVTRPPGDTAATAVLADDQTITRPDKTLLFASSAVAVA